MAFSFFLGGRALSTILSLAGRPRPLSIGRSVIVSEPPKPDGLLGKVVEIAVDMKGETTVVVSLDDGTRVTVERRCVRPTGES